MVALLQRGIQHKTIRHDSASLATAYNKCFFFFFLPLFVLHLVLLYGCNEDMAHLMTALYQLEARSAGHNHDIYEDHSGSDSWTFCTVCEMGRRHCSVEKNEASDYLSSFWLTSSARITTIGTGVERLPDHPYTFRHKREKSTHYLSTFRLMLPGSMATIGTRLSGYLNTCTYSGMNNRDKVVTSPSSAVPHQTAWPQWDKAEWLPDYLYTIRHEWERRSAVITCPSSNSPDQTEWS